MSSEVPHGVREGLMERVTILDERIRDPLGLCELSGLETSKQLTTELQCWED